TGTRHLNGVIVPLRNQICDLIPTSNRDAIIRDDLIAGFQPRAVSWRASGNRLDYSRQNGVAEHLELILTGRNNRGNCLSIAFNGYRNLSPWQRKRRFPFRSIPSGIFAAVDFNQSVAWLNSSAVRG